MRPTDSHIITRARSILPLIGRSGLRLEGLIWAALISISLSAQVTDGELFRAYQREDMSVWKEYLSSNPITSNPLTPNPLLYEYGLCGYMVDRERSAAKSYVQRFRQHVEEAREVLPAGHYEMYMSAVYVYELQLKESLRPIKAMSLAKQATKLAPNDPLVLSYYGTCLFYAPKPFGSKSEALEWFTKAKRYFVGDEWQYCWVREANEMYIRQCKEKLKVKR